MKSQSHIEKGIENVPQHVAVVMDGNRRWARAHNLPVIEGHRRVVDDVLEPLIEHASGRGIRYMTFWAWSTENWQRDQNEVAGIMILFRHALKKRLERLHKKGVRVRTIGNISKFDSDIQKMLEHAVEQTKNNAKITATFALNYGGRDELLRAISLMVSSSRRRGSIPDQARLADSSLLRLGEVGAPAKRVGDDNKNVIITEQKFEQYLDTAGIPDPELIVRTGGEQRLSGFLPWQSVYSEFYFPTWYMPDFTPDRLDEALVEYASRKRRFGK